MGNTKLYFRLLFRNKVLSAINLLGLALGISSCIFISLFIMDELSFDANHVNLDRIYRVSTKFVSEGSVDHVNIASSPLASFLKQNYAEVAHAVRFLNVGESGKDLTVRHGDQLNREREIFAADANVFDVFTYPMVAGNPSEALRGPGKVVLTRTMAKKYFGNDEVVGKTIMIGKRDRLITGLIEDVPLNSDFHFGMLVSMDSSDYKDDWFDFSYHTYLLFEEKSLADPGFLPAFEKKLNDLIAERVTKRFQEAKTNITTSLHLQPMKGLHFQEPLLYDSPKGNILYTYIFSSLALLILVIGCLNYINFSIVQSIERSKEVGIRKSIGATFAELVQRYLKESFLFTILAIALAVVLVILLMPFFNDVTDRKFSLSDLWDWRILVAMVMMLFTVGILAGSYPAFYTSSIKPVMALKGKVTTPKGQLVRKVSIAAQFFISIGLLISTVVIDRQMDFMQNFDLGFKRDQVVVITTPTDSTLRDDVKALKEALLRNAAVKSVAMTGYGVLPGTDEQRGTVTLRSNGKDEVRMVNNNYVDQDYLPTLEIALVAGRNFDGRQADYDHSVMVNEALVKMMGWDNPLEQQVWDSKIIGVVRDFHYASLYEKVEPQVLFYHKGNVTHLFTVIEGGNPKDVLTTIEQSWRATFPDEPFIYTVLDESISAQYEREEKAKTVFTYFSTLTIAISCMGLFGLSSLTVYQRKKEIGIRKIVGADFLSILLLFSKEYMLLILLAILAVSPLVWIMMDRWLQTFPFRVNLSAIVFLSIGISVLIVSIMTIAFSVSKISTTKPVNLIAEQ